MTIPNNAVAFVTTLGDPLGLSAIQSDTTATQASGASNATLAAIAAGFTPLSAFAYLVFVLLYVPCASTMGALKREVGRGWMLFSITYGVGLGWGVATIIYQAGTFAAHPLPSSLWIAGILAALRPAGLRPQTVRRPPACRRASASWRRGRHEPALCRPRSAARAPGRDHAGNWPAN